RNDRRSPVARARGRFARTGGRGGATPAALKRWATGRLPAWARDLAETQDLVQETVTSVLARLRNFEPTHEAALTVYLREALANRIRTKAIRETKATPARRELRACKVSRETKETRETRGCKESRE